MPLALVRCTSLVVALALAALLRRNPRPAIRANPRMLLAGLLAGVGDATGNMAYMLAKQAARLDVATVLAALYPAVTVLLACVVLNECVSRWQWLGVGLCLAAIALISF
jgi:drug/metabolite transporter (DMT)-like permease